MEISLIKKGIHTLRENTQVAYVGSVNGEGFPQIKGMLVLEHDNMKTHYFSTNTSSKRVAQFLQNPKASVYYVDDEDYCVYKFTAETVNYYYGLSNVTLSADEL